MPKLEPKHVQKDLEKGIIWPVYWLYGTEAMKSRELLKRIRKAVLGTDESSVFQEEILDSAEVSASQVLEAAQSLSLMGGTRFVVVRDAHALKESDTLSPLLGPCAKLEDLTSVTVFLSKDLDGRKKFSKLLTEKAAVVPCEEVSEGDREAWIQYLAQKRGITLPVEVVARLTAQDPWSLDLMDLELQKYEGARRVLSESEALEVLRVGAGGGSELFVEAFFSRNFTQALSCVEELAQSPEVAIPLLGLMAWNARHLCQMLAESRAGGGGGLRLSPFLMEKFRRWSRVWTLEEALALQRALGEVDFGTKQTPRLPLGLWASLTHQFRPKNS